jgi:hypothetical protein
VHYDIVGDIHGHAEELVALLKKLGYGRQGSNWHHPEARQIIFLGDFIDRGPRQVESYRIAREMVESGIARAVLGNHELNAMAWYTPDGRGDFLRPRYGSKYGSKNYKQHKQFLDEIGYRHDIPDHPDYRYDLHSEIVDWFFTLPLWIEEPGLGVVHACWHEEYMDYLKSFLNADHTMPRELLTAAVTEPKDPAEKDNPAPSVFKAIESVVKGLEVPLPEGFSFQDKDGFTRRRVRVRWWDSTATSYRDKSISGNDPDTLPDVPMPDHVQLKTPEDRVIFFGHYWFTDTPRLSGKTTTCLDYSVAKGGHLVAYRFDGETELQEFKLFSVASGEVV